PSGKLPEDGTDAPEAARADLADQFRLRERHTGHVPVVARVGRGVPGVGLDQLPKQRLTASAARARSCTRGEGTEGAAPIPDRAEKHLLGYLVAGADQRLVGDAANVRL